MKLFFNIAQAGLLALVAGCATTSRQAASNSGLTDICHVCRYHNDLACLCVRVDASTPKTEHQGTTYYFCSEDCHAAFLKKPARYVPNSRE